MFRRWRERRAFSRVITEETAKAAPDVLRVVEQAREELVAAHRRIAALPGTNPLCPCGSRRLEMRSVKQGRNWWKLWVCPGCGYTATLSELPRGSLADGSK